MMRAPKPVPDPTPKPDPEPSDKPGDDPGPSEPKGQSYSDIEKMDNDGGETVDGYSMYKNAMISHRAGDITTVTDKNVFDNYACLDDCKEKYPQWGDDTKKCNKDCDTKLENVTSDEVTKTCISKCDENNNCIGFIKPNSKSCWLKSGEYKRNLAQKALDLFIKNNGLDKGPIMNKEAKGSGYVAYMKKSPGNYCLNEDNKKGKFNSDLHCKTDYLERDGFKLTFTPVEDLKDIDNSEIKQRCGINNDCVGYSCDKTSGKCTGMIADVTVSDASDDDNLAQEVLKFIKNSGTIDSKSNTGLKYPIF
jgi:hypothetical protein